MKKTKFRIILTMFFITYMFFNTSFLKAQKMDYDMVDKMHQFFLWGGFNPDFSVAFIPVIINNYTEYDLELFQFNDKAKNYTHFPEEVKKYSTGHGFIYDNLQEPMQDLLHNNTDVWLQYTFDNGRQTPFIFHILCRPGDINYTLTKYNGIQTAIRIAKGIVRLIPKVGKVAAFLMTLANIGLTIDNLQRYKQNFYFLAYPYSWKMPEVPTMFWYTDSLGIYQKIRFVFMAEYLILIPAL